MIRQMIQRHRFEACAVCVAILIAACTQGQNPAVTPARDVTNRPDSTAQPRKGGSAASEIAVAARAVVAETLAYAEVDDRLVKGHFVFPENMVDPLPAVILIHEWWGLDNVTRNIADRIASEGFIVLAIDLYGSETAIGAIVDQRLLRARRRAGCSARLRPYRSRSVLSARGFILCRRVKRTGCVCFVAAGHYGLLQC